MAPKKSKEQTFSLTSFASLSGDTGSSWADEEGDFSSSAFKTTPSIQSGFNTQAGAGAGGWSRGGAAPTEGGWRSFNTESAPIPDYPPFTARVGNVSYDITEAYLEEFFGTEHGLNVQSVRLPRGPEGQVKGSAYVDFADKQSLEKALKLAGEQILDRKVSVQVAEQRSSFGGPGAAGGEEFDWSRRAAPSEGGFGSRAGGFGAGAPGEDRLGRFRQGNTGGMRAPEPELNWGARSGPPPPRPMMGGPPRDEPDLDWTSRRGAPPARGGFTSSGPRAPRATEPEPELDWGARKAPPVRPAIHHDSPRTNSAAPHREPDLDWTKRRGPVKPQRSNSNKSGPDFDWSARNKTAPSADAAPSAAPAASAASAAAPSTHTTNVKDDSHKRQQQRIAGMTKGFKALQLDDDDEEETKDSDNVKPTKEADSISAIQKAQREATTGGWSKA